MALTDSQLAILSAYVKPLDTVDSHNKKEYTAGNPAAWITYFSRQVTTAINSGRRSKVQLADILITRVEAVAVYEGLGFDPLRNQPKRRDDANQPLHVNTDHHAIELTLDEVYEKLISNNKCISPLLLNLLPSLKL